MDTRRNDNGIITSKRRHDVVLAQQWHYYYIMRPQYLHADIIVVKYAFSFLKVTIFWTVDE